MVSPSLLSEAFVPRIFPLGGPLSVPLCPSGHIRIYAQGRLGGPSVTVEGTQVSLPQQGPWDTDPSWKREAPSCNRIPAPPRAG